MFRMYSAIWRISWQRQIVLIILSIIIAGLAAVPLEYQKDIVNHLTDRSADQNELLRLCIEMFALILLSLGFKWVLGFRSGTLGEDTIRFLRARIYDNAVEKFKGDRRDLKEGTLATMISAEAEELGKFTGGAFSDPVVQIGTLLSVISFIAASQPGLGLLALCIITPQALLVLLTQKQVNRLVAERVHVLRRSTDAVLASELRTVSQSVMEDFDRIYETRRRMFVWKLSTKFVISALSGGGTVAVLLLGGWLVIDGRTDVGTVVAATAGLARLQGPTTFLIAFYRQVSATRVKFELLREMAARDQRPA